MTLARSSLLIVSMTIVSIVALATLVPAWAHHSHQNYLRAEYLQLSGTVREVHWINPHSWIYLEVAGTTEPSIVWALEGGSATALTRNGWTQDMVKVGDEIDVRCHPLKDGSSGCLLGFVTGDFGEEKEFD